MSSEFTNCVKERIALPPGFVLSWTSGVMQFYPMVDATWFGPAPLSAVGVFVAK